MTHAHALAFFARRTAACAVAGLLAAPAADAQEPVFPAGTELVTVDVLVLDKKGQPVEGLTREDFEVKEDGRPQTVSSFEAVLLREAPPSAPPARTRIATNTLPPPRAERSFVIVFDDVHMAPTRVGIARKAVSQFLGSTLAAGDEVTLVPVSGGAWWTARMPEGSADLSAALERLQGLRQPNTGVDRVSDWEAMQLYLHRDARVMSEVARRYYEHRIILEPPGGAERAELQISPGLPLITAKSAEVYQKALDRKRVTLGVLERVAESLAQLKGRKSIILISEGFVHEPQLVEFREVVRAARQANAAVYFLDARGLSGVPSSADAEIAEATDARDLNSVLNEDRLAAQGADSIAIDSGGFTVRNSNDLAAGLRRIADESRSYYLLGYRPANTARDGKFRKIDVRVAREGLDVRARRGYYAPTDGAPRTARSGGLDPRVRSALDSPYGATALPLRLTSYVLAPTADEKKAAVLLAGELDVQALGLRRGADGRFSGALDSYAVVASRETGENFSQEKLIELSLPDEVHARLARAGLPVFRDFTLPAGAYQARLLVRDRESGRMGTVRHEFTVPEATGLRTSTPILTDALQGPQSAPRPVPLAHRTFAAGARLFYAFDVYGAAPDPGTGLPRVSSGYLVRRADGAVLGSAASRPIQPGPQGGLSHMLAVSLEGVSAGDYELVLTVHDDVAGRTLEVTEPFGVVPGGVRGTPSSP